VNETQRRIALTGFAIVVLIVLFPPWSYFDSNTSNQASAGYRFLFSPPTISTYEEMFAVQADEVFTTRSVRVRLNTIRLIAQLVFAIFLTIGLLLRLREPTSWSHGLYLAVAFLAGVLFVLLRFSKF
jgi:hypothetical protein